MIAVRKIKGRLTPSPISSGDSLVKEERMLGAHSLIARVSKVALSAQPGSGRREDSP